MTLGSLFDGLGGWQLAAVRAGIKPLWSSEIDKFCRQITKRHFPDTVQLGDINQISDAPKVDIITAGSPCQDVSIAGKRSGINGERSGLFFKAVELVHRIRPDFFVWENVPGAFSSNKGNDFRTVLQEICQVPIPLPKHGWSHAGLVDGRRCQIAFRVLDAQFWGVPQRRKRIFLIADFTGRRAAQILFERTSLRGHSQTREGSQQNSSAGNYFGIKQNATTDYLKNLAPLPRSTCYGIGRDAFNQGKNAKFNPTFERELQPPHRAWCRRLCHAEPYQAAHSYRVRTASRFAG